MGREPKSQLQTQGVGASDPPIPSGSPPPNAPTPESLSSHRKRQKVREAIVSELMDFPSEARTKALAAAGKLVNDYERAELRVEEDSLDQGAVKELAEIKRQRARSRTGVVREDEAPQLPVAGSSGTH